MDLQKAGARARELDPSARAFESLLAPRGRRFQIIVDYQMDIGDGKARKVSSAVGTGPTWVDALAMFWNWVHDPNKTAVFYDQILR